MDMEVTIHHQVLLAVFVVGAIMGAVANKTNFCTMGAVSDWVNIGDTGLQASVGLGQIPVKLPFNLGPGGWDDSIIANDSGVVPILATKADTIEGNGHINAVIVTLTAESAVPLWTF